jgi:16S rRNA (cytosine1402-N4)-methyltransferase
MSTDGKKFGGKKFSHVPVLSKEVVELLAPAAGEVAVDCTLGGGGHALEIAKHLGKQGKIFGIDLDPAAIGAAEALFKAEKPLAAHSFVHGSYANIDAILDQVDTKGVDLILADVGISSYDLEQSNRGFTFQKDEPLDMRFDPSSKLTASHVVNTYTEQHLADIFREYAEDRHGSRIAKGIVAQRQTGTIATTAQLFDTIKHILPGSIRFKAADSARRIFQAIRIEVNGELDNLSTFLPKAFKVLAPGGRLAVISFHSLEDRIVKQFFLAKAKGCICPPDFPECRCGKVPEGRILTKKPVTATDAEATQNPRSRPAKLRAIQKVEADTNQKINASKKQK